MNLTKDQMQNLKDAVAKYESWLKKHEDSAKQGIELLNRVKTCSSSSGNNWSLVLSDVDRLFAQAYRENLE